MSERSSTLAELRPRPVFRLDDGTVFGRHLILGEIGRGAMGAVYHAYDRAQREDVALKVLLDLEPRLVHMFSREFRSVASLRHPNLLRLGELGEEQGRRYFTMELVRGPDFAQHVRRACGLDAGAATADFSRLLDPMRQLVRGAMALHEAGKVHCDLKPSNVRVTFEGRVVLLDFGLVNDFRDATGIGRGYGTRGYSSPEQMAGAPLSPASDFFAIGVMLYEALTARHPPPLFSQATLDPGLIDALSAKSRGDAARQSLMDPRVFVPAVPAELAELCVALLSADPAARPTGQQILTALGSPEPPSSPDLPGPLFVGRRAQLDALSAAFDDTLHGACRVSIISGPSGSGKTALLKRFLRHASDRGALVLEGRCFEREAVAYKGLDTIVAQLAGWLSNRTREEVLRLVPADAHALVEMFPAMAWPLQVSGEPDGVPSALERRQQAFAALRALLVRLSRDWPLVLAIDDLQWGDADSGALLGALTAGQPTLPLMVVGCRRGGPPDPLLAALQRARRSVDPDAAPEQTVELPPLDDASSREVVASLLGAEDARKVEAIAEAGAGNPFLTIELARQVQQSSAPVESIPRSIDELLELRIATLGDEERRVLEACAVAGRPVPLSVVLDAAGARRATVDALSADRLLLTGGEEPTVELSHDRLRVALLARLSPDDLQARNRALSGAFERAGPAEQDAVVGYLTDAGEPGRAVAPALVAAERAERHLAFERAASLYELLLRRSELLPDRAAVRARYAAALFNAGRTAEAGEVFAAAAALAEPAQRAALARRAGEAWLLAGEVSRGLQVLEPQLRELGGPSTRSAPMVLASVLAQLAPAVLFTRRFLGPQDGPPALTARSAEAADLFWGLGKGLAGFRSPESMDYLLRSLRHAVRQPDPARVGRVLAMLAGGIFFQINALRPMATRMLSAAQAISEALGEPGLVASVKLWQGATYLGPGEWGAARALLEEALRSLETTCVGVHWERSVTASLVCWVNQHCGDLGQSRRLAQRYVHESRIRGDLYGQVLFRQYVAWSDLAAGSLERAREHTAWISAQLPEQPFTVPRFYVAVIEAMCELWEGHVEAATATWQGVQRAFRRSGGGLAPASRVDNSLLEARLLLLGPGPRDPRAKARLERLAAGLESEARVDGRAWGRWIRAALEGHQASAAGACRDAAQAFSAAGLEGAAACMRWHAARLDGQVWAMDEAAMRLREIGVGQPDRWPEIFVPLGASSAPRRGVAMFGPGATGTLTEGPASG